MACCPNLYQSGAEERPVRHKMSVVSSITLQKDPMLEVKGLSKHFIGVTALNKVDMVVYPGELVSLIGQTVQGRRLFSTVLQVFYAL